jgi:hypothetical protein
VKPRALREDVPISSAELKAIEIATNFIFQQDEQQAVILTESMLTAG